MSEAPKMKCQYAKCVYNDSNRLVFYDRELKLLFCSEQCQQECHALIVKEPINPSGEDSALPVITDNGIKRDQEKTNKESLNGTTNGKKTIEPSGIKSLPDGELKQDEVFPKDSDNSLTPISDSKKLWRTPKNLSELAAQANIVATMVLNLEIDIEVARAYSSITKTVAQAKNIERAKSLMTREELNSGLEDY